MKLCTSSLCLLALSGLANAQYFSEGWKPGQQYEAEPTAVSTYTPEPTVEVVPPAKGEEQSSGGITGLLSALSMENLLVSAPAVAIFEKLGVNITSKLEQASKFEMWDDRIPLITDANYDDLIVNEELSPEEEKSRVWMLVISFSAARQDQVSKYVDRMFDSAFNKTVLAGDLSHVKWGRINYLTETYITTKWNIWRAPYLVLLKDRGRTIYFYQPYNIRVNDDALREFLGEEGWKIQPPWSSVIAPGGSYEWLMELYAQYFTKFYIMISRVPSWLLGVLSTSVASLLIGLLHRASPARPAAPAAQSEPVAAAPVPATPKKQTKSKNLIATPSAAAITTDSEHDSASTTGTPKRTPKQRRSKK